jgi:hypothetical protein
MRNRSGGLLPKQLLFERDDFTSVCVPRAGEVEHDVVDAEENQEYRDEQALAVAPDDDRHILGM